MENNDIINKQKPVTKHKVMSIMFENSRLSLIIQKENSIFAPILCMVVGEFISHCLCSKVPSSHYQQKLILALSLCPVWDFVG